MKEIWKDIKDYEGFYKISNKGRVKSLNYNHTKKIKILKMSKCKNGYLKVGLWKNKKHKNSEIHRIVGITFLCNNENKPQINHIDGNKLNNNIDNLEWCSREENIKHAYDLGLIKKKFGEKNNFSKLTDKEVLDMRNKYKTGKYTQKDLIDLFNISRSNVSAILTNKLWTHI